LEQLHAWSGLALAFINPTMQILETEIGAVNVMQSGIFQAADGSERVFIRSSLELNSQYKFDNSKKLWMHVKEFGNIVVPAGFTSN
jgi:hypothetical protein